MFHCQRFSQQKLRSVFGSFGATELLLILAILVILGCAGVAALVIVLVWYLRKREKDTD